MGAARRHLNRFQIRVLERTSRRVRLLALATAVGVAILAALPVLTGRTTPRWYQLQAAKLAVERAQEANAGAWSPETLRQAEAMLHVARVEHRHQELRFLLLRDFTQAEALLRDAEAKGLRATDAALAQRRGARQASQEAITRAAQAVRRGVSFAEAMHLGSYDRGLLMKSKIKLEEAELLHRYGRYSLAAERARVATTQAQMVGDHALQAASRYVDVNQIRDWRRWIDETVTWSRKNGAAAIVVNKEKHVLTLYQRGKPVRSYAAELGYNSVGNKYRAGDAATPEGRYHITEKKGVGQSTYHMALLLNYPNDEDRRRIEAARRAGQISKRAALGGLIEIHGEGGRGKDWTKGCVALSNREMEDLFARVGVGTPVTIVGGDGNGGTFTRLVDMHGQSAETGID